MNTFSRAAAAVLVAALALGGAVYLLGRSTPSVGAPTATPGVSPSPTSALPPPTQLPTSALVPFTSGLYGYTVSVPKGWGVRAATRMLNGLEPPWADSTAVESLAAGGSLQSGEPVGDVLIAASLTPSAATLETWTAGTAESTCGSPTSQADITVDGEAATMSTYAGCFGAFHQWVTVLHGTTAWHIVWINDPGTENADVVFFEQLLATFRFGEVPAAPAGSPAPS